MPGRDVAGFEQEIDRRRMAARRLAGLSRKVSAYQPPSGCRCMPSVAMIAAASSCRHRLRNTSLRLRISANTSTSSAFSMPRFLRITGSCQRRNGLVDSSSADRRRQRRLAVGAQPVDLGGALLQRRIGRVDGQREAGIGLRVFMAAIDLRSRAAAPPASSAIRTSPAACIRAAGRSPAQTACRRRTATPEVGKR